MPTVPPELLDRECLVALLDYLRGCESHDLRVDLSATPCLDLAVIQLLLVARMDGLCLTLEGVPAGLANTLQVLGLADALPLGGPAP